MYEVQAGTDGITFQNLFNVAENATGIYDYHYVNGPAKKVLFRIQQKSLSGEIRYSNIRVVDFSNEPVSTVQVYPTLYTGGQIRVSFSEQDNWQVNIYAADGRKVLEKRLGNAGYTSFAPGEKWANGFYLVETMDSHAQHRQLTRIVIQR